MRALLFLVACWVGVRSAVPDEAVRFLPGICAPTSYRPTSCDAESSGALTGHELSMNLRELKKGNITERCVRWCRETCSRCRYVSVSEKRKECSWFAACDTEVHTMRRFDAAATCSRCPKLAPNWLLILCRPSYT